MFLGESKTKLQDCLEGGWRNRNTYKSCTAPKTGFEMMRLEEINITQAIRRVKKRVLLPLRLLFEHGRLTPITLYSNQTARSATSTKKSQQPFQFVEQFSTHVPNHGEDEMDQNTQNSVITSCSHQQSKCL